MNITGIFPQPIGLFKLEDKLTKKELDFINGLEKQKNHGNTNSANNYIFNEKPMKRIYEFCQASLEQYAQAVLCPQKEVEIYMTQSWANYTKPGEWHHKYSHANSIVSGVFYVNTDPKQDKIFFYRDEYKMIDIPPVEWNIHNSKSWWFETEVGGLILFPSDLQHMVQTVTADETRVSIAFNTFVKGNLGSNGDLTELKL